MMEQRMANKKEEEGKASQGGTAADMERQVLNEVLEDIRAYHMKTSKRKIKDPRNIIHKAYKDKIQNGSKIFDRDYKAVITR